MAEPVPPSTEPPGPPSERTRVRRLADRGRYDAATVHAILDEAYLAHVGVVLDGEPRVLPMAYGRIGDQLYLHGAVGNALLRGADRAQVCVTVTHLDGLVLARSAFHHSMNYRSVVVLGEAVKVDDPDEKARALDAIVDQVLAGRSRASRPADESELRKTAVLRVPLAEASAKLRTGGAVDEPADLPLPHWAGVVPLSLVAGEPEQDALQVADPALSSLAAPVLPSRGRGA
ncbi:MAG: pyridoxamine 5'-phosphate oxidase family protein [Acidimicrobiales bacterium]|nr:pyridoxamine 5'-phosphate oxidase family protein [Acidimicrobiales bacterium]